jgi:2-isopropylmalate synthase
MAVQPNKAVVGANAFAHESGIHQDGLLKHHATYEIMRPETVGAPGSRLVLGKHSGTRGVDARCRELGYRLNTSELDGVYHRLIALADVVKTVDDAQLAALVTEVTGRTPVAAFLRAPATRQTAPEGVA